MSEKKLCYVAHELQVELSAEEIAAMRVALKTALEEKGWFRRVEIDDGGSDGVEHCTDFEGLEMPPFAGLMEGLSGSEKTEEFKLQMEIEKERIQADKVRLKQAELGCGRREGGDGEKKVKYVPKFIEGFAFPSHTHHHQHWPLGQRQA